MDSFTAAIAVMATQLCVALVMAGLYFATPNEKCTRYWALSELFIAAGVLVLVTNAGAARPAILILGNSSVICGAILQWWGIQAFYGKRAGKAGWMIGAVYFLLFCLLLVGDAKIGARLFLLSVTLLLLLSLSFGEVWRGSASGRSFGAWLVLGASATLMANNVLRIGALLLQPYELRPTGPMFTWLIVIMYLVPLAGTLLYATGLLLLYFERMVQEKHHLATHDELTGLLNRRAIVAGGEREIAVAARNRQSLAVAFIDIDFFKQVNDRLGHKAGDAVLADMAHLLMTNCRNIDLVGRYGGEEFCIVFPGVDSAEASLLGDRLMTAVRRYRFRDQFPVTVSIGLAILRADDADRSWNNLLHRADAELYKAKSQGRDRVCIAAPAKASRQVA
jgi:diguanylate cyclase (GGDEF)-like protein